MTTIRHIRTVHSDLDGNIQTTQQNSETCLMLSNEARVALLKFHGKLSRNDMVKFGMTDVEIAIIGQLYWALQ